MLFSRAQAMLQVSISRDAVLRPVRILCGVFRVALALCVLSVAGVLSLLPAQAQDAAPLSQWVNDPQQVLSAQDAEALTHKLFSLSQTLPGHPQIAVSLPGHVDDIDSYANEAFHATGLGRKGEDNGVLIVLDIPDRQSRIEVGYGLEGVLTDLQSSDILRAARPALQAGQYAQALNGIVDALADILVRAEPSNPASVSAASQVDPSTDAVEALVGLVVVIGLFVVLPFIMMRRARKRAMRYPGGYVPPENRQPSPGWSLALNIGLNLLSAFLQSGGGRRGGGGGGSGPSDPFRPGGGDSGGGGARDSW
ncbi:TPM domain-containing protein [Acetobacter tropicalis]|nr:TPM domain-containing protein [Acetobacter tropicalis]